MFKYAMLVVVSLSGLSLATAEENTEDKKPLITHGEFVKIHDPSVGDRVLWYINDHCFIRHDDGTWHLFGITHQEPADPLDEDDFAHATCKQLVGIPWDKQKPAMSAVEEEPWNETHLWAPHVIKHDGTYYMYYCGGDPDHSKYKIQLATSKDLFNWERHPENPLVVDGYDARDPFILREGDKWYMYYTANSEPTGGNHIVARVESDDLIHWSNKTTVYTDEASGTFGGPTESPFVVRRGDKYYLFIGPRGGYNGTDVFVSDTPDHWDVKNLVGHIPSHAAEVVRDVDGKWYVSRAGWGQAGVYLAPLEWHDGLDEAETNLKPGM
jgi:beta-fructofuranosidase